MTALTDIFSKKIDRPIEGVIKADDASGLLNEVEEYVLTNEIKKSLSAFLSAYNDYNVKTQNGVWISGFFGSGKSHLLKMLALLLENETVGGKTVAELFIPKCDGDAELQASLKKACQMPSKSILFNIDQKSDAITTKQTDALLSVFVKVFDEMCGYYGKQGYIAQFERDLDSRNLYDDFKEAFQRIANKSWDKGRTQAILEGRNIAKAYAEISGEPESSANGIIDKYRKDYNLSIEDFAKQVKSYIDKQPKDFRLNFFVDEVGQYIADNTQLMLNLQTLACSLASVCKGQAWIIVTAQEDMTSVFGEIGKKQGNDFSKIQARFASKLKLTSANVDEVIRKRLLDKKEEFLPQLNRIYIEQSNNFKTLFNFTDGATVYKNFSDAQDFISCYPFIPYQFGLFQSAIQNLSDHNIFEGRHNSVGERSMLGVFQTVAVNLATKEVGSLAPFDLMFEGIRHSVKSNAVRAILTAENQMPDDIFTIRTLKTLFLVKYVRTFRATARNMAVLMRESFAENAPDLLKRVQESLNNLESQSYIQRNGEFYEYLTDEEQDIEKEIKNTPIDTTNVSDLLNKIIFEQIIGGMKIRCVSSGFDYTFCKKMDGRNLNAEKELAIHIITPWQDRFGNNEFVMESMGKSELLVVMPQDSRLMTDVTLMLKTEKYAKLNGNTQNESVRRILDNKMLGNRDREREIKARTEALLTESQLCINGHVCDLQCANARQLILTGCQELIQTIYPNLKMLEGTPFSESNIPAYFRSNTPELFSSPLSEAETEILNLLRANKSNGLRTTIKGLKERLSSRPYGWYDAAIYCLIAKLSVRNKLEMRSDGEILDAEKQIAVLKNTHSQDNVTLELQLDYEPHQVKRVKEFYQEYFMEPANAEDPKQLGKDLLEKLKELTAKLSGYDASRNNYPFVGELLNPLAKLKKAASKPASYFFAECSPGDLDALCDDKEDYIDPIIQFMEGNGKVIFDAAKAFKRHNLIDLPVNVMVSERREFDEILCSPLCFKGNRMSRLKELTELLQNELENLVKQEIASCSKRVEELLSDFKLRDDFALLSASQQEEFTAFFADTLENLKKQQSVYDVRGRFEEFESGRYKSLLERLYLLAHPVEEEKLIESVPMPKAKVNFNKPWLESEEDLAEYMALWQSELEKLRKDLQEKLKSGKRIQL